MWTIWEMQINKGLNCGLLYKQKQTCKIVVRMFIIKIQEDSMSGGYVLYIRRDVLSETNFYYSQCKFHFSKSNGQIHYVNLRYFIYISKFNSTDLIES